MDLFRLTDQVSWQDIALTPGSVVFLITLFPTIVGSTKPSRITSLSTGAVLVFFAVTYLTLDLRFASVITGATGLAWLLIPWQSLRSSAVLGGSRSCGDGPETEGH